MMGGFGSRRKHVLGAQSHFMDGFLLGALACQSEPANQTSAHQGSAGPPRSTPSACQLPRVVWVDDGALEAGESTSLVPNPISRMDFWALSLVGMNLQTTREPPTRARPGQRGPSKAPTRSFHARHWWMLMGCGGRTKAVLGTLFCRLLQFLGSCRSRAEVPEKLIIHKSGTGWQTSVSSVQQLPRMTLLDDGRLWKEKKVHPWHPVPFSEFNIWELAGVGLDCDGTRMSFSTMAQVGPKERAPIAWILPVG